MSALVAYASSEEEDEVVEQPTGSTKANVRGTTTRDVVEEQKTKSPIIQAASPVPAPAPAPAPAPTPTSASGPVSAPPPAPTADLAKVADAGAPVGPALGPTAGPAPMPSDLPEDTDMLPEELPDEDDSAPPMSPYTLDRMALRSLTMPPVPNFDVPASPPGSPPASTTAKFDKFLELKKKGVHFNERLNGSSSLRNPALLDKLMGFAAISQEESYASALPQEVAVPTKFPDWMYADKLVKLNERAEKKKEEEKAQGQAREAIDFVSSRRVQNGGGGGGSGGGSGSGTGISKASTPGHERTGRQAGSKRSRFDDRERRDGRQSISPRR